jgi:hypothetical protein
MRKNSGIPGVIRRLDALRRSAVDHASTPRSARLPACGLNRIRGGAKSEQTSHLLDAPRTLDLYRAHGEAQNVAGADMVALRAASAAARRHCRHPRRHAAEASLNVPNFICGTVLTSASYKSSTELCSYMPSTMLPHREFWGIDFSSMRLIGYYGNVPP